MYFLIDGYWKDTGEEFSDYIVIDSDEFDEEMDEYIFFYGLSEDEIIDAIGKKENTVHDFVITSYRRQEEGVNDAKEIPQPENVEPEGGYAIRGSQEDTGISFYLPNNREIIKLCSNGDIFVKGKKIENDKELVDGLREFLVQSTQPQS